MKQDVQGPVNLLFFVERKFRVDEYMKNNHADKQAGSRAHNSPWGCLYNLTLLLKMLYNLLDPCNDDVRDQTFNLVHELRLKRNLVNQDFDQLYVFASKF